MAADYSPIAVESVWYEWWFVQGFFKPEYRLPFAKDETFVISAPPSLKCHRQFTYRSWFNYSHPLIRWVRAFPLTCFRHKLIELFLLAYRNRMLGKRTLFASGFDHAGISTQSVRVKSEGKARHDLGPPTSVEKGFWKLLWIGRMSIKVCLFVSFSYIYRILF